MKVNIIGDGSFGTFLKELLPLVFEIDSSSESVILAVPISAYDSVAAANREKHLINVCSVQKPSMEMVLRYTPNVTGLHPLFGRRTPEDRRNAIVTRELPKDSPFAAAEKELFDGFSLISKLMRIDHTGESFTPDSHDKLMAKTHVAAVLAAKQMKVFVERADGIPDELLPNSFRLMRDFVKTLDDMPQGTIESIMANPYF
jgi:prephenate dehydrogenase